MSFRIEITVYCNTNGKKYNIGNDIPINLIFCTLMANKFEFKAELKLRGIMDGILMEAWEISIDFLYMKLFLNKRVLW